MLTIDKEIRGMLTEVRQGQCLRLASWSVRILRSGIITATELTKLLGLFA